jgi:exopolyphosphatase/guanosine-5'-triphosphate,3'-diphosphate pyrophosphatase
VRVAAIDCGTNSIRLLVADVEPGSDHLADVERRMITVRLGEGVDRTGRLSDGALERTFAACEEYAQLIDGLGVERVRFVATSASRDAENRQVFVDGVSARIGVAPEVVSGDEEATLSFEGATRGVLDANAADAPFLVLDIGGGSTEFVLGTDGPEHARSVDMGCVRITERRLHDDPPTDAQVAAAIADIDALIEVAAAEVPLDQARTVIGLAGSVTTVAALALDLETYDSERIHRSRIAVADIHRVSAELLTMTHAERAALGVMHPGRVDVIGAGALILDRITRRVGLDTIVVSERDILDGIAWSLTR